VCGEQGIADSGAVQVVHGNVDAGGGGGGVVKSASAGTGVVAALPLWLPSSNGVMVLVAAGAVVAERTARMKLTRRSRVTNAERTGELFRLCSILRLP
jgi:hypothetical protein